MGKVLITGSGGFVGKHTVEWFLEKSDLDIVGLDSFRHLGDAARVVGHERYKVICHDLNAPISERTRDEIGEVDYIINCASISHVDTSISEPAYVWTNNVAEIVNILEFARTTPTLLKFIQCSTDEVFGPAEGEPHREWDPVRPSNPYAASKAAQDALCYSYWRTFNVPIAVTHCMNMVGTHQDPEKFLPMLISRIARGQRVSIHGKEGEIGSRMYLDCRNLADAWLWLLERIDFDLYQRHKESMMPKWNIAGLVEIDNLKLAQIVAREMGEELKYNLVDFHSTRPGHDRRYALDSDKIAATGWEAPIPLEQTLGEVIRHVTANPSWQERV